jgi:hypothetical protein
MRHQDPAIQLSSESKSANIRLIEADDLPEIVNLLTRAFGNARTKEFWQQVIDGLRRRTVPDGYPRFGYAMEYNGSFVGSILLIISTVWEDGVCRIRCNSSSWNVDPEFRSFGAMLGMKQNRFKGATVLSVSAAMHTWPILEAWGYKRFSNGMFAAIPILSHRPDGGPVRVIDGRLQPDAPFDAHDYDLIRDHVEFGCIGLWCVTQERAYPFVFRPQTVKKVLPSARLVYCSSHDSLVRFAQPIGLYLARSLRFVLLLDANGAIPGLVGRYFEGKLPKYFLGHDHQRLGDIAYTETALFGI